ncbi:serine/threonine protein phosphatase 1 [Rhodobacter aestuarii]|uniref:Serine/threonine protein phosphatase 1 n=1 Tax=Rhodobacter aestuarii TaxID=453582 RepID=A0A1N7LN41_9RHOB|nr:metallophosphoesterase family protein [Rhodobacter aestuarii]PTV95145.1 serine/threonine protein phosphatase 1 [Rhodobacter aestuarii]SIS75263.1 serine/threonine protein phosphatase 1 [Rhodobacter aestuarii]
MQTYAIGDIHGQYDLMLRAFEMIEKDRARDGAADSPVVVLGDLCDRGPKSAQVIAHLYEAQSRGENIVVIKGNHDRMFSTFLDDPWKRDPRLRPEYTWLHPRLGGPQTLASYGIREPGNRPVEQVHTEALCAVPPEHRIWARELPTSYTRDDAVFVHAGIRPGIPLEAQQEDDLVWIRGEFLTDTRDHGALIVHGHTALDESTHYGNRLNLDSSAGYGGPLSTAVIEGRKAWLLTPEGRQPLEPVLLEPMVR